jgi:hypothetical protein
MSKEEEKLFRVRRELYIDIYACDGPTASQEAEDMPATDWTWGETTSSILNDGATAQSEPREDE